jgi:hypothetical protein
MVVWAREGRLIQVNAVVGNSVVDRHNLLRLTKIKLSRTQSYKLAPNNAK